MKIPQPVLRDRSLTYADRVVYGGLSNILARRPDAGISLRWLARWVALSRSTVADSVRRLEAGGWLSVRDFGPGRVRFYTLDGPPGTWAHYVQVPRAILRADLPPLTRLVYALALDRSGGKPRRMSCSGLARLLAASRAAVGWAWVRLVSAGWLAASALTRGARRIWETRHGPGWSRTRGRRADRVLHTRNGLFGGVSSTCAESRPPLRINQATQETPSRNLKANNGKSGPARAPTPEEAAHAERLQSAYPGPAGHPDSVLDQIREAEAAGVPIAGLMADAERYAAEIQGAGRDPGTVMALADWLLVRLFHVKRV